MQTKPELLSAMLSAWILSTVACAALPFMHGIAGLEALGMFAPLFVSLVIGVAITIPLGIAVRRLCDLGPAPKDLWATVTKGVAARLGIVGWGLPVGFMFAEEMFLQSKDPFVAIPSAIIWPLGGIAFGIMMRWQALRRHRAA